MKLDLLERVILIAYHYSPRGTNGCSSHVDKTPHLYPAPAAALSSSLHDSPTLHTQGSPKMAVKIHSPSLSFHVPQPSMTLSHLRPLRHLSHHLRRSSLAVSAASVKQDTTLWTPTPLLKISPAAESIFSVTIDVSESPELAASYTKAGQYLQLRLQDPESKPSFLAIASRPSAAASDGVFEFLVKSIVGSTAELLCGLQKGDVVELSPAMGKGFDTDQISPPENYQTVLIFATGSGIRYN